MNSVVTVTSYEMDYGTETVTTKPTVVLNSQQEAVLEYIGAIERQAGPVPVDVVAMTSDLTLAGISEEDRRKCIVQLADKRIIEYRHSRENGLCVVDTSEGSEIAQEGQRWRRPRRPRRRSSTPPATPRA